VPTAKNFKAQDRDWTKSPTPLPPPPIIEPNGSKKHRKTDFFGNAVLFLMPCYINFDMPKFQHIIFYMLKIRHIIFDIWWFWGRFLKIGDEKSV
jgi:hypothetical protein